MVDVEAEELVVGDKVGKDGEISIECDSLDGSIDGVRTTVLEQWEDEGQICGRNLREATQDLCGTDNCGGIKGDVTTRGSREWDKEHTREGYITIRLVVLNMLVLFSYLSFSLCLFLVMWLVGVIGLVSGEFRSELGHLVPKLGA